MFEGKNTRKWKMKAETEEPAKKRLVNGFCLLENTPGNAVFQRLVQSSNNKDNWHYELSMGRNNKKQMCRISTFACAKSCTPVYCCAYCGEPFGLRKILKEHLKRRRGIAERGTERRKTQGREDI